MISNKRKNQSARREEIHRIRENSKKTKMIASDVERSRYAKWLAPDENNADEDGKCALPTQNDGADVDDGFWEADDVSGFGDTSESDEDDITLSNCGTIGRQKKGNRKKKCNDKGM